ncbi:hypothetical protein [Chondromyces apiculatus]|uniref:Uncharacterized protein n=1 Tax=Chondromyces apiculatus DSM 436 TaxID=1192034 RepID=A0A017TFI1_9BACT|nr:hypothetical protein [Chondromyces apiculatus]EYF07381.1 Hypothetical protein CAP_0134 [Chondromyces apiculatus DSM 436]
MSYPRILDALARLHADVRFREAFLADAEGTLRALGLPEETARALARVDRTSLSYVFRIVDHHRRARVSEHLGWFDLARRPDLGRVLARYLADVPPQWLNRDEAIQFCLHVEATATDPPYLRDLARYERLRIEIAWGLGGTASRVEAFAYPVLDLLAQMHLPGWPEAAPRETRIEIKKVPSIPAVITREPR